MHRSFIVSSDGGSVIKVSFDWPDPVIASNVVNTLVNLYVAKHMEVHANPETYALIEEQAGEWERKLRASEKKLQDFKLRHSITSLPEQRTILLDRLAEAKSQAESTETEIQESLELVATLEGQLSELDKNVELQEREKKRSETLGALKAKLVELELQGLKEEISRVKEMIAEEERKEQVVVVSGKSPIRQTLGADLLKAKARLKALKAKSEDQKLQILAHQENLRTLDSLETELKGLERQVSIDETNYKLYLTKFEEAKISETMDKQMIANIRVIRPAMPPRTPVKPKKKRNVLIGGFLGLIAGIGVAFLIEVLHPVFRTREDVEQFLGLPVLTLLPKEK